MSGIKGSPSPLRAKKNPWTDRLEKILEREGNDKCCDCDTPHPRWVAANIGCFICIRCSGIHRSLGTHISRVRSVELDDWNDEQLQFLERKGNKRINLIYEASIPSTTRKITAQSSFEEATSFIKAKYNGDFKSASSNGWRGASVGSDSSEDGKKTLGAARSQDDASNTDRSPNDLKRRTLLMKQAPSLRVQTLSQETLPNPGTDSDFSDSDDADGDSKRTDDELTTKARASLQKKVGLQSSGELTDVATEVWNTLEQTGVGSDLKRMQVEERKRMMQEAKLKKEAKKKEEKERKKKEDEEQKRKKKDEKKQKRKSWWRGRAMDGEEIALKREMEAFMNGSDDTFVGSAEEELKQKRENDHQKVRERMRVYEEAKRAMRGQTPETTCPHCHSHITDTRATLPVRNGEE